MSLSEKYKKFMSDAALRQVEADTSDEEGKEKRISLKIADLRKMPVLDIIARVLDLTSGKKFTLGGNVGKCLKVIGEKLDITPVQALFLSIFANQCDDSIRLRDLADHFEECRIIDIIKYKKEIDGMVMRGILSPRTDHMNNPAYRLPSNVLEGLCEDKLPSLIEKNDDSIAGWIKSISTIMDMFKEEGAFHYDCTEMFKESFRQFKHLECVRKIRDLNLDKDSLKLFMFMCIKCIVNNDNHITRFDLDGVFSNWEISIIERDLVKGNHPLMEKNLIEHVCEEGIADPHQWCLTDYCKEEFFDDLELSPSRVPSKLRQPESIVARELYFDPELSAQVDRMKKLLQPEKMDQILEKLSSKGYRKGFACLFYGIPGTGKTETVLQLARLTGRGIMQVDIARIRDKWVGETEKHIKAAFDSYRKHAKDIVPAPILFFNEADALFMTRKENAETGVDKMENAMQNIILQELETLEGILIATTNLTSSLDPAFERRFLFKIEFKKPSAKVRRQIWQSMLPDLGDEDALMLATRFDFSGGQIENIARKRVIDDILDDREGVDIEAIVESCRHECIAKDGSEKIGFTV